MWVTALTPMPDDVCASPAREHAGRSRNTIFPFCPNHIEFMRNTMIRNRTTLYTLALGLLAIGAVGCSDDTTTNPPAETTVFGATKVIAGGNVRSFMTSDASGNPTAIGLRISATTVNSVPTTEPADPSEYFYEIALPAGAATKVAVQDISLDWGPGGHPPAQVYTTPHFDMHFYTVPRAERMAWSPTDTAKLNMVPNASLIPPAHITDGTGIPFMGLHYVDITSHEFDTAAHHPFDATFIWGYYNGSQVFIEPMITQAYLQSKANFSAAIKQPASYSRTGVYWPTKYSISFDAATNEHVVTMSEMVKR